MPYLTTINGVSISYRPVKRPFFTLVSEHSGESHDFHITEETFRNIPEIDPENLPTRAPIWAVGARSDQLVAMQISDQRPLNIYPSTSKVNAVDTSTMFFMTSFRLRTPEEKLIPVFRYLQSYAYLLA